MHTKFFKLDFKSKVATVLLCYCGFIFSQTATAPISHGVPDTAPVLKTLVTPKTAKSTVETWDKLTLVQKTALQPLYANWSNLSDGQKRKWIAVSANFEQFSDKDKAKLRSRMTGWASLSAKQREQARINFAQTKTLTTKDKQAKWESYKSLPPETKQALANIDVLPKPTGAATVAKPQAKDKLVASTPKTDKATVR